MKLKANVTMTLKDSSGRIKEVHRYKNLVVDQGFDLINTLLRTGTGNFIGALGIAWNDPDNAITLAVGDTDFQTPTHQDFKSGGALTVTRIDERNIQITASWIAAEPTPGGSGFPVPIRGLGLYWGAAATQIIAGKVFLPVNKESADILNVVYDIELA